MDRADLIRKLLAKADSTTFPDEREALLAKVAELRLKKAEPPPPAAPPRTAPEAPWFPSTATVNTSTSTGGFSVSFNFTGGQGGQGGGGNPYPGDFGGVREPRRPFPNAPCGSAFADAEFVRVA